MSALTSADIALIVERCFESAVFRLTAKKMFDDLKLKSQVSAQAKANLLFVKATFHYVMGRYGTDEEIRSIGVPLFERAERESA